MRTPRLRGYARRWAVFLIVSIALCLDVPAVLAQPVPDRFAGRRLEDALRVLQMRGLRLVFSSELVTPDMRVGAEPRARAPNEQLAELLRPHGLTVESGPGGVLQIVRLKKPAADRSHRPRSPPPQGSDAADLDERPAGTAYRERVTVFGDASRRHDIAAGAGRRLTSYELNGLGSHIADDPLRVVQALPGVATGDDFRSEYSVRGSHYRHAGIVIDGIVASWLQHAALGRGDTGTLTMIRGDVIQEASLLVGAYPRLDSSQIGPQLNLTLREGSRTARRVTLGVSGTSSMLTGEGPVGTRDAGSPARGSWLVAVRASHSEWPVGRSDHDATVFGFRDLQSKVVYDVRPDQQISLSLIAGESSVEREGLDPFALGDGRNRAAMVGLAWRSAIGSRTIVTQRVSSIAHDFLNRSQTTHAGSRGTNNAHAYRVDVSQPLFRGVVDAGGHVRLVRGSRHAPMMSEPAGELAVMPAFIGDVGASWLERSTHASFQRAVGRAVTLAAGLRLSDSTLVDGAALDRWLQAEWFGGARWRVHASTGVTHQFPGLDQVSWPATRDLRPERATSVDLGIGQRLSPSIRWDATVFARRERDALREPDVHARVIAGVLSIDHGMLGFENALTGSARGVELTVVRQSQAGLSGWIGYTYGVARYRDAERRDTFPADFDQRHGINISGFAALPWKTRLGLIFRGGTNVPIRGYLETRGDALFAGPERNRVRLPAYARLDVRAERTFDVGKRRLSVFVDALNVLNRANAGLTRAPGGPAEAPPPRGTGEAVGFTERLYPRLLTAGLRFEFGRRLPE
jgi:hypothetical protein